MTKEPIKTGSPENTQFTEKSLKLASIEITVIYKIRIEIQISRISFEIRDFFLFKFFLRLK